MRQRSGATRRSEKEMRLTALLNRLVEGSGIARHDNGLPQETAIEFVSHVLLIVELTQLVHILYTVVVGVVQLALRRVNL